MKTKVIAAIALSIALTLTARAQVPGIINYQGRVISGGTNFDGTGQFEFALVDSGGSTTYWSNGVSAVSLTVTKGLYSVLLGDTTIANMSFVIPATVFSNSDVRLRVWFNDGVNDFQQLSPDQRLAAVGYAMSAAFLNVSGTGNTLVGVNAGNSTMTGPNNTAIGADALFSNTSGNGNTAAGVNALFSNTNGVNNTAIGFNSLQSNVTGIANTASGGGALKFNTTGSTNTASGFRALFSNTTGSANTANGDEALRNNTTGSTNIALGFDAGLNLTTGNNNIDIGNPGVAGDENTIRIGTPGTHTNTYLAGTVTATAFAGNGAGLTSVNAVNFSGSLGGDVTGAQGATTIARLQNVTVSAAAPAANQVLRYDGSQWTPSADVQSVTAGTGLTGGGAGAPTLAIAATAVTPGSYGSATAVPVITVNAQGQLTAANNTTINVSLNGDVTGTQGATVVGAVGGVTAANVASGANAANNATSANTPSTIVKRDGSGNINVGTVNGNINAANGLVIETRNSDPGSPVTGQMWLRTDL